MPVELVDKGVGLGNDGVHARIYFNLRGKGLKSSVGAPKQGVGGFQCFLGTDIQPIAGDGPGVHGLLWIQPLDEPDGLVRIVAFSDVAANLCQRGARVKIEGDADQGTLGLSRFFLEAGNLVGVV